MANEPTQVPIPDSAIERDMLTDKYIQQWANALHAVNKTFTNNDAVRNQLAKCVIEGKLPEFPGKQNVFLSEVMPNKPGVQRQLDAEKTDIVHLRQLDKKLHQCRRRRRKSERQHRPDDRIGDEARPHLR